MIEFLCQAGAFVCWFLYGSFFEWAFHKYLFHSPRLIRATFNAHALVHHQIYKGDDTYDVPSVKDPDQNHIAMDWFALPLFIGFHLPLLWFVQWITGLPSLWGGVAAITAYYLGYEILHYFMHVPRNRWIERTRIFRFLNAHHRLHHKYQQKNLNVLLPLADLVLGTLRTQRATQAASPSLPAPRRPR